ncbi:MAG: hypothetical protein RIR10_495 [Planctomycetota bacterium]
MTDADRANFRALAHAYLDGTLAEEDRIRFEQMLASDSDAARELAQLVLLHDALDREFTSGVLASQNARFDAQVDARADQRHAVHARKRRAWLQRRVFVAATLLLAVGLAWIFATTGRDASASDVLARIVEALRTGDRTYVLRAIEGDGRMRRRDAAFPQQAIRPPAPIDGALVFLRNPASYVLVRRDAEGREVVSGSDGASAWIVPADGPVRVSSDPARFRGALPGGRLDIPFIDPHADLSTLARNYDIVVQKPAPAAGRPDARIVATRRADARGGPKEIEIDFDAKSALVRAIRLVNLPQAQGGPRAIEFELIDDAPLSDDFFQHTSHHAKDRAVIEER